MPYYPIRLLLKKDKNWSLYIQWKNWKIIGKMRVIMVYNVVVEIGFPFNRSNNTNKAHTTFCVQPPRWELLWWRRFDWNVDILFVNVRIVSYRLSFYPDIVSIIRTFHVLSFSDHLENCTSPNVYRIKIWIGHRWGFVYKT